MSGIFQGLTNSDGRVRSMSSAKIPGGAVQFRGMWVFGDRIVPYLVDAGQPRVFHDGIAFDAVTGLLLVGDGSSTPTNISMGGLRVGANGSVIAETTTPDVIHQGVGLTNAGVLTIVPEGIPEGAVFYAPLAVDTADALGAVDTFERASDGLYQDSEGVWQVAGPNVARFETSKLLMEQSATNVFLNSDAAVTQLISLPLGNHTLSVRGSGSVTSADGTGTATGHGTATDGSPVTIDVTVAGNFLFDVSGSPDYVQVELGVVQTSPIITQGATASRAADLLKWDNGRPPAVWQSNNPGLDDFQQGWNNSTCPNVTELASARRVDNLTSGTCNFLRRDDQVITVGRWYRIRVVVSEFTATSGSIGILIGGAGIPESIASAGDFEILYFAETVTDNRIQLNLGAPTDMTAQVDWFSVEELTQVFNQAQGTALITLNPGYSKVDQAAVLQGLLSLDSTSSANLLYMDGSFKSTDGVNTTAVATPSFVDGSELRIACIYGPVGASALQAGYSVDGGGWVWSVADNYDGDFIVEANLILARAITLPGRFSNVILYDENKGTVWVENNY